MHNKMIRSKDIMATIHKLQQQQLNIKQLKHTADEFESSVPTLCASAAAARAVSADGFSNIRCTVKSSESKESEYSGLMSTFCLFSSTTSHGKNAVCVWGWGGGRGGKSEC